jgi:hypothetical protein
VSKQVLWLFEFFTSFPYFKLHQFPPYILNFCLLRSLEEVPKAKLALIDTLELLDIDPNILDMTETKIFKDNPKNFSIFRLPTLEAAGNLLNCLPALTHTAVPFDGVQATITPLALNHVIVEKQAQPVAISPSVGLLGEILPYTISILASMQHSAVFEKYCSLKNLSGWKTNTLNFLSNVFVEATLPPSIKALCEDLTEPSFLYALSNNHKAYPCINVTLAPELASFLFANGLYYLEGWEWKGPLEVQFLSNLHKSIKTGAQAGFAAGKHMSFCQSEQCNALQAKPFLLPSMHLCISNLLFSQCASLIRHQKTRLLHVIHSLYVCSASVVSGLVSLLPKLDSAKFLNSPVLALCSNSSWATLGPQGMKCEDATPRRLIMLLLLRSGDVHINPGPCADAVQSTTLSIGFLNIYGLFGKDRYVPSLLDKFDIFGFAETSISRTGLQQAHDPKSRFANYHTYYSCCDTHTKGVALTVRNNIQDLHHSEDWQLPDILQG